MSTQSTELRVKKIKDGTVIDHIKPGYALAVLKILGVSKDSVTKDSDKIVTVAINVPSSRMGKKDVVKVEGRALAASELNRISLITPDATINFIQDYEVRKKVTVSLPKGIEGTVRCINPNCITNAREPIAASFKVASRNPLRLRCNYCGRFVEEKEILDQF